LNVLAETNQVFLDARDLNAVPGIRREAEFLGSQIPPGMSRRGHVVSPSPQPSPTRGEGEEKDLVGKVEEKDLMMMGKALGE